MKTITTSVLILFFLFTTSSCFHGVANKANELVFDADGEPLLPGVEYYIVSAIRGPGGGGLDLGSSGNSTCPKFVIQKEDALDYGRPVAFWPVDTHATVISVYTDLRVVFAPALDAYCRTETQWKLDDYDHSTGKWWITTGSAISEPGPSTLNSWFKIWIGDFDRVYRFTFCPSVCDSCITLCNDIGRYSHDGHMRLALDQLAGWQFIFIKASKAKV